MSEPELSNGEKNLAVRALRYYISCEQQAIQKAWMEANGHVHKPFRKLESQRSYATKLERECREHITAAQALITKLRPNFRGASDG